MILHPGQCSNSLPASERVRQEQLLNAASHYWQPEMGCQSPSPTSRDGTHTPTSSSTASKVTFHCFQGSYSPGSTPPAPTHKLSQRHCLSSCPIATRVLSVIHQTPAEQAACRSTLLVSWFRHVMMVENYFPHILIPDTDFFKYHFFKQINVAACCDHSSCEFPILSLHPAIGARNKQSLPSYNCVLPLTQVSVVGASPDTAHRFRVSLLEFDSTKMKH